MIYVQKSVILLFFLKWTIIFEGRSLELHRSINMILGPGNGDNCQLRFQRANDLGMYSPTFGFHQVRLPNGNHKLSKNFFLC